MKRSKKKHTRIIAEILLMAFFIIGNLNASEALHFLSKKNNAKSIFLKDKTVSFLENGVSYYAYSPGVYAPYGIMMGVYNKGYGIYFSARINKNIFKKSGQYYFDGTSINTHALNWNYNNEKIYSRYEVNAGFMGKVLEKKERFMIALFAGVGVLRPRYMYSFTQVGLNNIPKKQWVLYKEISKISINTEAGFIFLIKESISFHVGLSGISRKHERMVTFGIGISKRKNAK